MNEQIITPILLAGGSGTRLWPLSRRSFPKQFSALVGDKSLFQQTALRLTSSANVKFAKPITVTNSDFRFIVAEQLQKLKLDPGAIIIEPEAKNTAPAILASSIIAASKDKDAVLLVAPSDHVISNLDLFHEKIQAALPHLENGKIVTFGVLPKRPETGYGYMQIQQINEDGAGSVCEFVEKPMKEKAEFMIEAGNYLWNAGIFMFRASDMMAAFENYQPDILSLVKAAVDKSYVDLGFIRLAQKPWAKLGNISIDYAIMERASNLMAIPMNSSWSDLGDWNSVWQTSDKDSMGMVLSSDAYAISCKNSIIRTENGNQVVVAIGLEDVIAVAMSDAVLVAHRDSSQDIRSVVELLKNNKVPQMANFPEKYRPWGASENLVLNKNFEVKRLNVKVGAELSLQKHEYREEHWVVVQGEASIIIDGKTKQLSKGQSIYVPSDSVHKIANIGSEELILIEIRTGTSFSESDIIRFDE